MSWLFFSTSDLHPPKRSILHEVLPSHRPKPPVLHGRTTKKNSGDIPNREKAVSWRQNFYWAFLTKCRIVRPYPELSGTPQLYLQPSSLPEPSYNTTFLRTFPQNLPVECQNLCTLPHPKTTRNLPRKSLIAETGPTPKPLMRLCTALLLNKTLNSTVLRCFSTLRWSAAFGGPRQTNLESMQVQCELTKSKMEIRNPNLLLQGSSKDQS